ncbi:alpha/beta hydrolase [uncultured Thermosynechococcus sp.]|uniref:alpha/beta fold hydrolase n=1 Tax=uncultured Thermosynechococcus sp. TaxID=436945 RepID=UPI002616A454|nr:alpha/beta hydrolase [uncultured Thermosynechococcus sp.]
MAFCPPTFVQQSFRTSLGRMVYYTPSDRHWGRVQSRPPLVFLHSLGGGSSHYEWSQVYPAFAARYRVVAPDLIGWGESDHPARDYTSSDYWLMIAELLRMLGTPVTVVASSLTAGIVVRLAVQQPHLFQRLCLVCPSGFNDFGEDQGQAVANALLSVPILDRLIYTVAAANPLAVRNFLSQFIFADPQRLRPETVEAYLEAACRPNAEWAALSTLKGNLSFDLSRYLPQLTIPTMILWGEKAKLTPLSLGERLYATARDRLQQLQVIPKAGVLPHLEQPEWVIYSLRRDFLV